MEHYQYSITYYAPDDSMGDTRPLDCQRYREWALEQIEGEYPDYLVHVSDEPSPETVETDDESIRDEVIEFCKYLWDRCPWNWMD